MLDDWSGGSEMADRTDDVTSGSVSELPRAVRELWPAGIVFVATILFPLFVYGLSMPVSGLVQVVSTGALAAAAAIAAGGLTGFLFGIPRALQRDVDPSSVTDRSSRFGYRVNTNLEQISDWLTKILVGVGLTQIASIGSAASGLISSVADGMGGGPAAPILAGAILVYSLVGGFLGSYFLTRTVLTREFIRSDVEVSHLEARLDRVEKVSKDAQVKSEQVAQEVQALGLVERLLNAPVDSDGPQQPLPTEEELREAMEGSNPDVLRVIFARAHDLRATTWKADKSRMARTIPVFRVLIALDPEERFHRPRGELGFALKDMEVPQWREAESLLDSAIRIRDRDGDDSFRIYEFNRALCRIVRDSETKTGVNPDGSLRQKIIDDLRIAAEEPWLRAKIENDDAISGWRERNSVDLNEFDLQN
jgi:hypothetical protein